MTKFPFFSGPPSYILFYSSELGKKQKKTICFNKTIFFQTEKKNPGLLIRW